MQPRAADAMTGAGGAEFAGAREAYLWACHLDIAVRKPGNVSRASPGHGMQADQFVSSADLSAEPLVCAGLTIGERIEAAIAATREAVGCNTNLGIVLLCAPLALAWERCDDPGRQGLSRELHKVLRSSTVDDARAAYRAIAHARPAGLGQVEEQDVGVPPTVTLRAAMQLAASRDRIARQYDNGYEDVFALGLAELVDARAAGSTLSTAVQRTFLAFLASEPDSHIVRKLDSASAQIVTEEAVEWLALLRDRPEVGCSSAFAAWDESLKRRRLNPGSSADLTVCTLFVAALLDRRLTRLQADQNWHGNCMETPGGDAAGNLARGSSRGAFPKN